MESSCSTNNGMKMIVQYNRTLIGVVGDMRKVLVNNVAGMDIDVNSGRTQRRQENRELSQLTPLS